MENENTNINENKNDNKIIAKNIFKFDGAIGRLDFLITCGIMIGFTIAFSLIMAVILYFVEPTKYTLPFYIIVAVIFFVMLAYISFLNYAKRIYDIIGDKKKALLYTTLFVIANISLSILPIVKYIGAIIGLFIFGCMLFKKGKLVE